MTHGTRSAITRLMLAFSLLMLIGLTAGAVLVRRGPGALGWPLILAGVAGEMLAARWYFRARNQPGDGAGIAGTRPARIIRAVTDPGAARRATVTGKWRGSASVPGRIGYIDLVGLGVFVLAGDHLAIRGRGEMITDASTCGIYAARRMGGRGIEMRLPGQPSYYFWTRDWQNLIGALKAAGFDVTNEEVRFP